MTSLRISGNWRDRQRREQDPDFAFIDDLRSLLEVAEVPEEERSTLLDRFEEALERDFIGQEDRNELVEALADVFDRFNINADVGDSFTSRFADLLPVWDDIRLSSEESAAYLRELRDFLLAQGVPEASIDPLIAQFERAFADNVVNFREGQNLFGQLNTLLSEFNIPELSLDEFGAGLADGLEATFDNLTLIAELADDAEAKLEDGAEAKLEDGAEAKLEDGAEVPVEGKAFIEALRNFFISTGVPASVYEPFLQSLEQQLKDGTISLTDAEGNALTSIPLVDAEGNTIGTLSLTSTSIELKDAQGNVISSLSLAAADGTEITSIPLVDAAGNTIGTLSLTKDSVELKDAAGNVISSVSLTDADGNPVKSINLTDADGNPVKSINLTDAEGNPVTSVNLTDADGNVITSIEVDGSTFLDALTAFFTPPTTEPEAPQAP